MIKSDVAEFTNITYEQFGNKGYGINLYPGLIQDWCFTNAPEKERVGRMILRSNTKIRIMIINEEEEEGITRI